MNPSTVLALAMLCCAAFSLSSSEEVSVEKQPGSFGSLEIAQETEADQAPHTRQKRTLLLKKKLIGAGLLGFGLGALKGYKAGYYSAPEVHHVYLSPPPAPVKYVEYIEKPVYVERIIERPPPVFASHSQPSSTYGAPW